MRAPPEYRCTNCKRITKRVDLTVKRVAFMTMGANAKRLRQRTEAWLCPTCRDADPIWNMEDARPGRAWHPDGASAK